MSKKFFEALEEIEREKDIPKETILEAFEQGIISAYRKSYGKDTAEVRIDIKEKTNKIVVYAVKTVVEEVTNSSNEISLEDAIATNKNKKIGDIVEIEVTPKNFGRIAIQSAKQRVQQAVIEAEREIVYNRFKDRELDLITGLMNRRDDKNIYINLDRVDGILPIKELLPNEEFVPNARIKVIISKIEKTTKGPIIFLSRTSPLLIKRLFELEVPEIFDGIVEIKAVARDAGDRSKVLVHSKDENVDPIGACIGSAQSRINSVINEVKGEKIDLALYSSDPKVLITNALSPAKVISVIIIDEKNKQSQVIVPDDQLSLAIGKRGQNARLAHQLTGWKIDIKSERDAKRLNIEY
ncbi:transcription termination/antitermination protein NusA [Mycoplasmatota bacterium]|nr:transcription termination/antitermination protein NusA [Mycoplasmatota bacterium]